MSIPIEERRALLLVLRERGEARSISMLTQNAQTWNGMWRGRRGTLSRARWRQSQSKMKLHLNGAPTAVAKATNVAIVAPTRIEVCLRCCIRALYASPSLRGRHPAASVSLGMVKVSAPAGRSDVDEACHPWVSPQSEMTLAVDEGHAASASRIRRERRLSRSTYRWRGRRNGRRQPKSTPTSARLRADGDGESAGKRKS